jgi:hypothetical protein
MSNMKCASLFSNFLFDDNEHFKLVYRLIKIKFCKLVWYMYSKEIIFLKEKTKTTSFCLKNIKK